jgi:hypothetical protein
MRVRFAAALATALVASAASAAPVGPVLPEAGRWRLGGEVGFHLERMFQNEANKVDLWESRNRFAYLGRVGYGLAESWEVYGRLGAASLEFRDVNDIATTNNNFFDLGTEFAWGVGLQGIAARDFFPGVHIAVDAQYFSHPAHDGIVEAGTNLGRTAEKWTWDEWSFALLFQAEPVYAPYVLYAGPVLSGAMVRRNKLGGNPASDLDAKDNVGAVVGLGFDFVRDGRAFVEGRLVDEQAINVGFSWLF